MLVLGIDPGLKAGSGLALINPRRRLIHEASHGIWSIDELLDGARRLIGPPEWWERDFFIGIEIMTPMGAKKFNARMLRNAQFVGEIIGSFRERHIKVVEVTKRQALLGIGCKGKAGDSRVRRAIEAIFGEEAAKLNVHALDAVAAAWAAWLLQRRVRVR